MQREFLKPEMHALGFQTPRSRTTEAAARLAIGEAGRFV
jgi:hypothetical protein